MRRLDTAYNYGGFAAHQTLARTAGDLLPEFTLSTKVGFFRRGEAVEHTLHPVRLRDAINKSVDDLGVVPEVVFLHSPERTLSTLTPEEGRDRLAQACAILAEATAARLCGSWGIACWDSIPLLAALKHGQNTIHPTPDVVMMRAGLSVGSDVLDASEEVVERLAVEPSRRWGMSPFGGSTANAAWHTTNIRAFLHFHQECSNLQAAFRVAYEIPRVARLAVGASSAKHLDELITAARLQVNDDAIRRYRALIRSDDL